MSQIRDVIDVPFHCAITISNFNCKDIALDYLKRWNATIFSVSDGSNPRIICRFPDRNVLYVLKKSASLSEQIWCAKIEG